MLATSLLLAAVLADPSQCEAIAKLTLHNTVVASARWVDEGPMASWLREDLMANTNEWLIAYWHSPPYTKGSHDSDNDADTSG